jgi:hypothetical protein
MRKICDSKPMSSLEWYDSKASKETHTKKEAEYDAWSRLVIQARCTPASKFPSLARLMEDRDSNRWEDVQEWIEAHFERYYERKKDMDK